MPARLDIAVQRNEAFTTDITVLDNNGVAIDVTGRTFAMQVKEKTSTSLLQAATVEVTDAVAGKLTITLSAAAGTPLHSYGDPLHTYQLPYDLVMTDSDDVPTALLAGYVIVSRGVTG